MEPASTQIAIVQRKQPPPAPGGLPLFISIAHPIPELPSPYHVRVRVHAVGINPTDHKMVTHFYMEGNPVGCDFAGVIDKVGTSVSPSLSLGSRVCGAEFPYRPNNKLNGAFQQWITVDSRHLLKLPESWSFTQAAALGAIGWGTACLAQFALNLKGFPSCPTTDGRPVLVYGGATATGLIAIQLLKLSGYRPIAVCSTASSAICIKYGAIGAVSYVADDCVEQIKRLSGERPIKHALDCITDAESTARCFASLSRVGGRYACLEDCPKAWRTRNAVKVSVVMGFELQGNDVDLGHPTYSRTRNQRLFDVGIAWAREVQTILNAGELSTKPPQVVEGGFASIIQSMERVHRGDAQGQKLVVSLLEKR